MLRLEKLAEDRSKTTVRVRHTDRFRDMNMVFSSQFGTHENILRNCKTDIDADDRMRKLVTVSFSKAAVFGARPFTSE